MSYNATWITDESNNSKNSLLQLFCGDQIGSGSFRRVYKLNQDPTLCVKVEYSGTEFCNITEMQVWRAVKGTPLAIYFAPCIEIDGYGIALIQKRCRPFESEDEFNKAVKRYWNGKVPEFFDDVHYGNFGILVEDTAERLVCMDYGFNHFAKRGVEAVQGEEEKQLVLI